jgi:hypothetical protein
MQWRLLAERKYSSQSFLTSALNRDEWSTSRIGRAVAPGKVLPVPILQEAGWAPEPVWTQRLEEKSFCLCSGSNLDHLVIQPVARHYTDWATWLGRLYSCSWLQFTPGKEPPLPTGYETGGSQSWSGHKRLEEKYFASARDQTPFIQSVVRHETDISTPAPCILTREFK